MKNIVVGISHGDINGVSYELIIKTFNDAKILDLCTPVLYGSEDVLNFYRKRMGLAKFHYHKIPNATAALAKKLNLVSCVEKKFMVTPGQSTGDAGSIAYDSLRKATDDLHAGAIDVLVTCPINKHNIQSDQFAFSGHTEFIQASCGSEQSLMMMVSDTIRLGLLTNHTPIASLSDVLSPTLLKEKLGMLNHALIQDFGIVKPRLAVLGFNPHAGDNGLLGDEDERILTPVLKEAVDQGMVVDGPFSADGFWASGHYKRYDGILAMYHDQGLIPFKMLAESGGVNYTAGLPVVRTSPAHGVAYDIAGTGKASADSFRHAIYLASDIIKHRAIYKEIHENVLVVSRDRKSTRREGKYVPRGPKPE